jgi:hypothetical protein
MERYFLITVHDLPKGDHPDAPAGIPADTKVGVYNIKTTNDGFGRVIFEHDSNGYVYTETTFVQLENTLADLV